MANTIQETGHVSAPLPELFKALEACRTPYTTAGVLYLWEYLITGLHELSDGFQHYTLSEETARDLWTSVKHTGCNPLSIEYRDPASYQVVSTVSRQNDIAVVREAEFILKKLYENPVSGLRNPIAVSRVGGAHSTTLRYPTLTKFYLLSCIAKHASGLSLQTHHWLSMIWMPQPLCIKPLEPPYDGSLTLILRHFGSTASDNNTLYHFLKITFRLAMAIADIWTTSQAYLQYDNKAHLPGYKWYLIGFMKTTGLLQREVEDPFSQHPRIVRELIPNLNWGVTYAGIWRIAQEARAGGAGTNGGMSLRQAVSNTLLGNFLLMLGLGPFANIPQNGESSKDRVEREDLVRSSMRAVIEEPPMLEWGIINRVQEPEAIHHGAGTAFYADHFDNEVDSPFEVLVEVEGVTEDFHGADLEAYGPRHQLINFTRPRRTGVEGDCCICQEGFTVLSSASMRGVMVKSCSHLFHAECIDDWVNGTASNSHLCPVCRQQMVDTKRPVRPIN